MSNARVPQGDGGRQEPVRQGEGLLGIAAGQGEPARCVEVVALRALCDAEASQPRDKVLCGDVIERLGPKPLSEGF